MSLTQQEASAASSRDAAQNWFGYGRWNAPYWFIGMEPGGPDGVASCEMWRKIGATDLIDCREHHLRCGCTKWHGEGPRRTQPIWRRLIQALLGLEDKPADLDAVYAYQRTRLGAADEAIGETAIVELGALHAPGLATLRDRKTFRGDRIATLHLRLLEYRPVFALCYGPTFKGEFEAVVGSAFDADGFSWANTTLCVMTPGLTSHLRGKPTPWAKPAWWVELGREMRRRVGVRFSAELRGRLDA